MMDRMVEHECCPCVERLREALENEWRIAHNDYCGCSLDGRMKCDHPKPKTLATEAPQ